LSRLDNALNIAELKKIAARKLPAPLFNYIDGGADDEGSRFGNLRAFDSVKLIPEYLVDVSDIDTSTSILGQPIEWPVFCSPTGMSRLFHHEGEQAVAKAAQASGTYYSLSTLGSTTIEDVAAVNNGPKCFQIYVLRDRGLTREFIQRCKDAGFTSLALTVDVPVQGNRERELRYGFTVPPKLKPSTFLGMARKPAWCFNHLVRPGVRFENIVHKVPSGRKNVTSLMNFIGEQMDPSVDWDDMAWMIDEWGGPFAIKGILSPADAVRAAEVGCSAIMISNHGGRQLDESIYCFDALPGIVEAVGDRCEVILDGGVRRGTDVVKALAMGADACSIGRPYLYGLAAGGEAGVSRALQLLRDEVQRAMGLMGCRSIADIAPKHVTVAPGVVNFPPSQ
jgi:L-lactate dehydrogenase (cytochrome)